MQTNEIKEATPFESLFVQTAPTVSHLFLYLICVCGILICLWAFKKSKKIGYLIIGIYFLHPLIGFLLGHIFGHVAVAPRQTPIRADLSPHIQNLKISLRLPVYDFLILSGVWLLSKKEDKLTGNEIEKEESGVSPADLAD